MADRMELLADDIFAELQDVFVDEMNREEFQLSFAYLSITQICTEIF